ncbi:MAG: formylglycine-generating enzyme family protein [Azonexaceae bacterium]|nr:formylglycine-generating enzyme family protein [Azonexaceae bacterium]
MNTETQLRAIRPAYLLVPRPGQAANAEPRFWSMRLDGLHRSHLKNSAKALRDARKRPDLPVSEEPSLHLSSLRHGLAQALGSKTFDAWQHREQELIKFLNSHGMTRPADLIRWPRMFSYSLTARELSDRLFNSGLPMPDRIFTGVGSKFFAARGRGRIDIHALSKEPVYGEEAQLNWCIDHADQTVLSLDREFDWDSDAPDHVDLTGTDLLLHAFHLDAVAAAFNLLGDNLVEPMQRPPEFRSYNASEDELSFDRRIFNIFRQEIDRSESGWVEVIPFSGNDNLVFLKGKNGAFDWVIRNQRDEAFTGNPYHPILKSHELPTAMQTSGLNAHLYFTTGEWYERLEHSAETRHYEEGGTVATWPGYSKLLMRELLATRRNYAVPTQPKGRNNLNFIPHRLNGYCLMVSPPVTIQEFWRFFAGSDWRDDRISRSSRTNTQLEADLAAVNLHDDDHLPATITWFDALAYCRYYEEKTGLPVRLLEVEEWKQISPPPAQNIEKDGWGDLTWVVEGGDGKTGGETAHRYPEACGGGGYLRFGKEITWTQNQQGLPFVSVVDFGEWLADYADGYAPVANAATGKALMTGPLDRDRCPAHLTMRYKGLKVGFRLCYVAHPDA